MMLWRRTWTADPRAALVADGHYSRKTPGSPQFSPPGRRVVLVLPHYRALWVSSHERVRHDGYDAWFCTIFRNLSGRLATVPRRQAIEATLAVWSHVPLPRDGFMTFIDETKVTPSPGQPFGWTFQAVGFVPRGRSSDRDLLRLQLPREALAGFARRPVSWINNSRQLALWEERS
jgi:hypothetical protein